MLLYGREVNNSSDDGNEEQNRQMLQPKQA